MDETSRAADRSSVARSVEDLITAQAVKCRQGEHLWQTWSLSGWGLTLALALGIDTAWCLEITDASCLVCGKGKRILHGWDKHKAYSTEEAELEQTPEGNYVVEPTDPDLRLEWDLA